MIPKSMAPKLIKFAHTSKIFIKIKAKSKDKGIVDATISPPLQLPSKKTKTKITISAPSTRLVVTVLVVSEINSLRSKKGSTVTPFGNDFSIRLRSEEHTSE